MHSSPRPTSPHAQIYRWYLTSALSIAHRITGLLLSLGTLLLGLGLLTIAVGPAAYGHFQAQLLSWYGLCGLLLWTLCLYYHLCNGIRHLFWDAGYGFALHHANASAWAVLAATVVLTTSTWVLA